MRSTRRSIWSPASSVPATILFLFLTFLSATIVARAADEDDDGDDYDVKARVVRISLINGEARLKRNGNTEWEHVQLNSPLVEGDAISTDRDARVEIQIDARNFVRLGSSSMLRIVTLRDEGVALSLVEGTASVRLAKFDKDHEYFEIDAPKATLAAEKKGLYRIDVSREGRVRLSARDGGRARIYSETSGFYLRDGRTAELIAEGADAGDWEFVPTNAADSWDGWVANRERYLAERLRYDVQYYDSYVWGAEDLDAYGNWVYVNDYGWIWRPHTTVINNYYDWAPYRYGSWVWISPYGWTWVGQEPWGWAPYHYGRWVYYNNYWAWCPRSKYYRHRSWWRPALVAFSISFGDNICWYPLHYHQRDPHSRHRRNSNRYPNSDRLRPLRSDEIARLQRVNPAYYRAVTAVAARDFGAEGARLRPADEAIARRVVSAEPLQMDLPVRPAYAVGDRGSAANRTERITVARPARVAPPSKSIERATGAATRVPGVQLDSELRRTRILNGREGIVARPALAVPSAGVGDAVETRPTGAVARPERVARPARESVPTLDTPQDSERQTGRAPQVNEFPTRIEGNERERAPVRVPVQPRTSEESAPVERSARPERDRSADRPVRERSERSEQPSRPEPSEQPVNVGRPERSDRQERPEAPHRYDPPPRNDPPARSDPAPRSDPPPRNDPPPR
ncbi:MAG TPA: DUF6600 domain-containing protein, partial [Pyrinomonadaceae bacterium]|nr:DUF6600 domain-containing protein [Pyrinomonadaceae bacterium]